MPKLISISEPALLGAREYSRSTLNVPGFSIVASQDAVSAALGTAEEIRSRLREQAEANFTNILEGLETEQVNIERMIVVGAPFLEILKIARDLDLPMIVMGVKGRSTPPEEILFGSTAEKVLRGSRVPVLVVPY